MIKFLINLFFAALVIVPAYCLFYFEVVPKLIHHYRRFSQKRREYDKEIHDIQEEDEK